MENTLLLLLLMLIISISGRSFIEPDDRVSLLNYNHDGAARASLSEEKFGVKGESWNSEEFGVKGNEDSDWLSEERFGVKGNNAWASDEFLNEESEENYESGSGIDSSDTEENYIHLPGHAVPFSE